MQLIYCSGNDGHWRSQRYESNYLKRSVFSEILNAVRRNACMVGLVSYCTEHSTIAVLPLVMQMSPVHGQPCNITPAAQSIFNIAGAVQSIL